MRFLSKFVPLLFIFSLVFTTISPAQEQGYESIFGDSSTSWKVLRGFLHAGMSIDSVAIKYDTIIDGKKYKSLTKKGSFKQLIREDTSEGKIWFRDYNKEVLVMDISISENDSFNVNFGAINRFSGGWHQVDSVFKRGNRKIVSFIEENDRYVDTIRFIEGIGPSYGFDVLEGVNSFLICTYKDGFQTFFNEYQNSRIEKGADTVFKTCPHKGKIFTGIPDRSSPAYKVSLGPNPASTNVNFHIEPHKPYTSFIIKLYNNLGQQVLNKKVYSQTFQIQKPGEERLYFYKLLNNQGKLLKSGKILFMK